MMHDINAAAARCFDAMGDEATNLTDTEQEAGAAMIHTVIAALAGAWAFYVNFGQSRRLRDLLLASGLVVLGVVDFISLDLPTMLQVRSATAGAPMIGGLLAAFPNMQSSEDDLIADGEAIALRPDGRPQPFQVTGSRFGRSVDVAAARTAQPLSVFFFDVLHRDGVDLLDAPTSERTAALDDMVPAQNRVDRLVTSDPAAAGDFLEATLAAGHEGVMAKSLTASYEAGRRGAGWLKVKPVHTLDLVVLAGEWGSGRRRGKLSNIHLSARDPATGGFTMLGKTFKGMTDAMLDWQTVRFQELAVARAKVRTPDS